MGTDAGSLRPVPGEILVVMRERRGVDAASLVGLAGGDLERAATLKHPGRRAAFVAGRRLLCDVMGVATGAPPEALTPLVGENGRLVLPSPWDERFMVSLSHGERHDALAVAIGQAVGVDIEDRPPPDLDAVAATVMTDGERVAYGRFPAEQRERAFLQLWTRKEAVLKAAGVGFLVDPRSFAVGFASCPVSVDGGAGLPEGPWIIHDVAAAAVPCAVATTDMEAGVRLVVLDP